MKPETQRRLVPALAGLVAGFLVAVQQTCHPPPPPPGPAPTSGFETLEPGLELGVFQSPKPSRVGDSRITVVRADPATWAVKLFNASAEPGGASHDVRAWAEQHHLAAAMNAAMFETDHRTATELMVNGDHVNNGTLGKDNAVLAFDPVDASLPALRILDRECDDFDALRPQYRVLVQSIRMLSCDGRNVWEQQPREWSQAVIGVDGSGRLLMIFSRSPWSSHDFVDILRALPLDVLRLQHAEGGPPAQLAVRAGGRDLMLVGSYETGAREDDGNTEAYAIPNVIGVARRE
jgi:hypothetical protein